MISSCSLACWFRRVSSSCWIAFCSCLFRLASFSSFCFFKLASLASLCSSWIFCLICSCWSFRSLLIREKVSGGSKEALWIISFSRESIRERISLELAHCLFVLVCVLIARFNFFRFLTFFVFVTSRLCSWSQAYWLFLRRTGVA